MSSQIYIREIKNYLQIFSLVKFFNMLLQQQQQEAVMLYYDKISEKGDILPEQEEV